MLLAWKHPIFLLKKKDLTVYVTNFAVKEVPIMANITSSAISHFQVGFKDWPLNCGCIKKKWVCPSWELSYSHTITCMEWYSSRTVLLEHFDIASAYLDFFFYKSIDEVLNEKIVPFRKTCLLVLFRLFLYVQL